MTTRNRGKCRRQAVAAGTGSLPNASQQIGSAQPVIEIGASQDQRHAVVNAAHHGSDPDFDRLVRPWVGNRTPSIPPSRTEDRRESAAPRLSGARGRITVSRTLAHMRLSSALVVPRLPQRFAPAVRSATVCSAVCDAHHRISTRASVALPISDQKIPLRE